MTIYFTSAKSSRPAVHTAQTQWWSQLASALTAYKGERNIYLNNLGENDSASFPPSYIASLIKEGAVWIDWCGWPFFRSYNKENGAIDFFRAMGIPTPLTWNMNAMVDVSPYTNMDRALILTKSNPYIIVNSAAPSGTARVGELGGLYAQGVSVFGSSPPDVYYTSFAVKYGKGAYIYAYGNTQRYGAAGAFSLGVAPAQYIPFVQSIVHSLPAAGKTTSPQRPQCTQYGEYVGPDSTPGRFIFRQNGNGYYVLTVVDSGCVVKGRFTHSTSAGKGNPAPTSTLPATKGQKYNTTTFQLNGQPYPGIVVGGRTYMIYTVLNALKLSYSVNHASHVITLTGNGKQIQGVVQNNTTYIPYFDVPGIYAKNINGEQHFTTSPPVSRSQPSSGGTTISTTPPAGVVTKSSPTPSTPSTKPQNLTFLLIGGGLLGAALLYGQYKKRYVEPPEADYYANA